MAGRSGTKTLTWKVEEKTGKKQWKNLSHAYRSMLRYFTQREVIAWIGHYNRKDAEIIKRIYL